MSPGTLVDQLEILVNNSAPSARIKSVLADLRGHIALMERELDHLRGFPKPEENTVAVPTILRPELNVPLDPPAV